MLQHTIDECEESPDVGIAYWYCDFRDNPQPSPSDVLASVVDQLVSQASSLSPTLCKAYEARDRDPLGARSLTLLRKAILELGSSFTSLFLFVDALDEFPATHIETLLDQLISLCSEDVLPLHMMFTSQQHKPIITRSLSAIVDERHRLELEVVVQADIRAHIRETIKESTGLEDRWGTHRPQVLQQIEFALTTQCNGS